MSLRCPCIHCFNHNAISVGRRDKEKSCERKKTLSTQQEKSPTTAQRLEEKKNRYEFVERRHPANDAIYYYNILSWWKLDAAMLWFFFFFIRFNSMDVCTEIRNDRIHQTSHRRVSFVEAILLPSPSLSLSLAAFLLQLF